MDEKQRHALERFSQQGKVVALVEDEQFWREEGQKELEKFGLIAQGFSSVSELETAELNIGAIVLGFPILYDLQGIEPAVNIAVKRRAPLVVTTTSGLTPQSVEKKILVKGGVSQDKVPMECVSGRQYNIIIEAIAQGLYKLTDKIKESSSYRRFSLKTPTES